MRNLFLMLLFAWTASAQTPTRTVPQQGPPPRNLSQQPDGHYSANQEPANAEKFEVHVVKAGETLSGIAGDVLHNPRLWPQLWEQNEHIINPHWIYPNDKILIRPVTLITEAVPPTPREPEPPPPPASPTPAPRPAPTVAAPPEPKRDAVVIADQRRYVSEVKPDDLYCSGFVRRAAVAKDLLVISKFDSDDGILAADAEYVYISQGAEDGIQAGTVFQVVRPTKALTNPNGRNTDERTIGMHYLDIGQVRVVITQPDFSIARVVRSCGDAIEVGDMMLPFQEIQFPSIPRPRPFSPVMKATGDAKGTVLITKGALLNSGSLFNKGSGVVPGVPSGRLASLAKGIASEGNILYIDAGQTQGVKPGDSFIIYKNVNPDERLYDLPKESDKVKSARRAVGELIVLKVEERASSALVTYATEEISLGDSVERR